MLRTPGWRLRRAQITAILAASCLVASVGCGGGKGQPRPAAEDHMMKAAKLYMKYPQKNMGRMPQNEGDWKKFVDSLSKAELSELKIDDVADVMKSPRDNQPYGIVFGVQGMMGGSSGGPGKAGPPKKPEGPTKPPVILYEKEGVGGKRLVAYSMGGSVTEVSEEEFKNLVPNPK